MTTITQGGVNLAANAGKSATLARLQGAMLCIDACNGKTSLPEWLVHMKDLEQRKGDAASGPKRCQLHQHKASEQQIASLAGRAVGRWAMTKNARMARMARACTRNACTRRLTYNGCSRNRRALPIAVVTGTRLSHWCPGSRKGHHGVDCEATSTDGSNHRYQHECCCKDKQKDVQHRVDAKKGRKELRPTWTCTLCTITELSRSKELELSGS
jgi:hypothetical protein